MRYNPYNQQGEYGHLVVTKEQPLLEFLLENVQQSRNKIKLTLQGRGIRVNGKTVTQFDYQLLPGMKVAVSKTKRNQAQFKSRYLRIVLSPYTRNEFQLFLYYSNIVELSSSNFCLYYHYFLFGYLPDI